MKKYLIIILLSLLSLPLFLINTSHALSNIESIISNYTPTELIPDNQINNYDYLIISSSTNRNILLNENHYTIINTQSNSNASQQGQGHLPFPYNNIQLKLSGAILNVYYINDNKTLKSQTQYTENTTITLSHYPTYSYVIFELIIPDPYEFEINYNNQYSFMYNENEYINTPSKQGYLFKGWRVETDNPNIDTLRLHDEQSLNTELYGAYNDIFRPDRPIVNIYEQWLKVTVEQRGYISFDLNGGIGSYPDYYYFITNVQTPEYILNYKPTKDGYFFGGWQYLTRDNALNGSINPRELSSEDDGIFKAIWIAGSYESGYDDGFINGQDNGFINGRNQYGIFYNNKWYTASEYGQIMYYQGLNETDSFGFIGLLGNLFGGIGSLLAIELLPNISIGAIILIPIVFGLLAFILGRKK